MVKSVVIVGGGTAGWMTANYLTAAFGDRISVTVVESDKVSTIGVGEATFSTIRHFFDYLDLEDHEWMPACHGTYKLGIRFENWRSPGDHFYHLFERVPTVDGFPLNEWWMRSRPSPDFDQSCCVLAALCDAKRSPRHLDGALFEPLDARRRAVGRDTLAEQHTQFPYAYHFDAAALAVFLMLRGVRLGVRRIVDHVVAWKLDEQGWIDHLVTRDNGPLRADLYIDCTGFRGILIDGAFEEPFISYENTLPNNRAVALRVPNDMEREGISPYTTATAMDSGWIWTIPLHERNGMGYVYASEFCSPEEAERTLRRFAGPEAANLPANHIRMRIGRHRNSWVGNCVAIGLASGFVEPLESTGIFFIQHGVEQLIKHFPTETWSQAMVDDYNRLVGQCLDGVREFLVLHYRGAARSDTPYWRAAKEREVPDGMAERLELWQHKVPDTGSVYPHYHGIEPYSYMTMLMGLGGIPVTHRGALDLMDDRGARGEWERVRRRGQELVAALPSQYEYFRHLRAGSESLAR